MKFLSVVALVLFFGINGCAQVPKEAVELSATVGRDLAEVRKSHTAFIDIYYTGLINNINKFVDEVYLPYQIQKTLSDDVIREDMLSTIESASRPDVTGTKQKEAYEKIQIFHQVIHEEVEAYRKLKLQPVQKQYDSVLNDIRSAYEQIHYANSIVTGHLASVVKVHDAQNDVLDKLNLTNLRTKVGYGVASASDKISDLVAKAKGGKESLDSIVSKFDKLPKIGQ